MVKTIAGAMGPTCVMKDQEPHTFVSCIVWHDVDGHWERYEHVN